MQYPVLFLDIDGVLNGHHFDVGADSNRIEYPLVVILNRVLDQTGCQIVISSAWRYMVLKGAMTLRGFGYLLRTHGVHCKDGLLSTTAEGEASGGLEPRGQLIRDVVVEHALTRWAVIDDLAVGGLDDRLVRTDGRVGITHADADKLITILRRRS